MLGRTAWTEPALLIGAGYGEWRRTTLRWCARCGWRLVEAVASIRPDRRQEEPWPPALRCSCLPAAWAARWRCDVCGRRAVYIEGADGVGGLYSTCSVHHVGSVDRPT